MSKKSNKNNNSTVSDEKTISLMQILWSFRHAKNKRPAEKVERKKREELNYQNKERTRDQHTTKVLPIFRTASNFKSCANAK